MGDLKRIVGALMLALVVACGPGSATPTSAPGDIAPPGPDNRPRLALVIGIGEYRGDIPSLPNPVRDAELMAQSLQAVGFQMPVPIVRNATRDQLETVLTTFARALDAAGADAIGLIYFAGHGMQINDVNYLLPSDARRPTDLPVEAALLRRELSNAFMPAEELLLVLGSRPNGASILILDACRDNPLTRSIGQATRSGVVDARQGLYDMSRATGVLIAYATNPNDVSLDGGAGRNSPYAEALASEMLRGGTVYEVFNRVRARVEDATGGRQSPKETNGLRGSDRFCFGACANSETPSNSPPAVNVAASCAQAEADWQRISAQTSVTAVRVFSESVPPSCGVLRGIVQTRLDALSYEASQAAAQATAARSATSYREYLDRYPGSAAESDIRARLASCRSETVTVPYQDTQTVTFETGWQSDNSVNRGSCEGGLTRHSCRNGTITSGIIFQMTPRTDADGTYRALACSATCRRQLTRTETRETCS